MRKYQLGQVEAPKLLIMEHYGLSVGSLPIPKLLLTHNKPLFTVPRQVGSASITSVDRGTQYSISEV